MNKYYILKPAVGTKETGMAFPAVESYDDYDFDGPRSVYKINSGSFPDFEPDIRFKLARGAKLCDMMGQATINANGFLISEKLKILLEQVNTVPCKFYNATIEDKKQIYQYYWIHFVWEAGKQFIDYSNSEFYIKRGLRKIGTIRIDSFENYIAENNKMNAVNYITFENLRLKGPVPFDCFILPHSTKVYISPNLYKQLIINSLTGIMIETAFDILLKL